MIKIGLVLSGGGARGLAQIGVLRVLKKNNIQFQYISGSSIGALIGACYAFDQDPEKIYKVLEIVKNKRDIYDYTFSTKGIIKGDKIEHHVAQYFTSDKQKVTRFEDLKIPLIINATDIVNGGEKIFASGPLLQAIMASLSYPGFFTTRKIEKNIYVDGGVVNPLPLNLITDVDYLILIDVAEESRKIDIDSNIKDIVLQSTLIMQKTIVDLHLKLCKTKFHLIKPDLRSIGIFDFNTPEDLCKIGEIEAMANIDAILSEIKAIEDQNRLNADKKSGEDQGKANTQIKSSEDQNKQNAQAKAEDQNKSDTDTKPKDDQGKSLSELEKKIE